MAGRVIEAEARIRGTDLTGGMFDSVRSKLAALQKAQSIHAKGHVQAAAKAERAVASLNQKAGAIDGFRAQHAALQAARVAFRQAEADVQRLARTMRESASPTREMARQFEAAQRNVKATASAFADKRLAVNAARQEMSRYGVTLQNLAKHERVIRNLNPATAPLGARAPHPTMHAPAHAPAAQPAPAGGGTTIIPGGGPKMIGAAAAGYAAIKAHGAIIDQHHDYQAAYKYQEAVLGLTKAQRKAVLEPQALKIGQDTKFTNADIVRAQTDIGGKLPKELQNDRTIAAITESVKNYALAMKVSMEEGAEAVIGVLKSRNMDLSTPEAAERSSRRVANRLVDYAKNTGAKHLDIVGRTKFGSSPAEAAGFSEQFEDAITAQLQRQNYEGAMQGTFTRAAAVRLANPSRKALAGLSTVGLNFVDYLKPGTRVGADGLDQILQQRFGRKLSDEQREQIEQVFDNPEATKDRGSLITALSDVLNSSFARQTKDGKVNAQDAERISKALSDYHTLSAGGVDTERLLQDIIAKKVTPAQAGAILGSEHGGRLLGLRIEQLEKDLKTFRETPDNRASSVADKMQEGAQGEWVKMTGAVQTFTVALGEASDGLRSKLYKSIADVFDYATRAVRGENALAPVTPEVLQNRAETTAKIGPEVFQRAHDARLARERDPEGERGRAMQRIHGIDAPKVAPGPAMEPAKVKVDTTEVDTAKSKAAEGGAQIKSSLDVKAAPQVDTSSIDAAIAKAEKLKATLDGASAAGSRVGAAVKQSVRSSYADVGISE